MQTYHRGMMLTGRILIAIMLGVSGLAKYASIDFTAGYVASEGLPLDTPYALGLGSIELLLGIAIGAGFRVRISAFLAAVYLFVLNLALHRFLSVEPEFQFAQQILFMKNLCIVGGLIFIAGVGESGSQSK